jgi:hypothetical protein
VFKNQGKKKDDRSLAGTKKGAGRRSRIPKKMEKGQNMAERSGFEPEVEVYAPTLA